jgi:uncharacterized protein
MESRRRMTLPQPSLYTCAVSHRRLAPLRHALAYRVFNLLLDVDRLGAPATRWLSHNRWNLFSIYDRDHGAGTGVPLKGQLMALLTASPGGAAVSRIFMFCYPRVLGYVFNPLTVYFCYDGREALSHIIYEVNNTFGGRNSYVIPVDQSADTIHQGCAKALYVSPFNAVEGRYSFHVKPPGEEIAIGVALRNNLGPCMKAHVAGHRLPLTDANLLRMFFAFPLMTFKIMGGIHWEALKLWAKGLKLKPRPAPASPPISLSKTAPDL